MNRFAQKIQRRRIKKQRQMPTISPIKEKINKKNKGNQIKLGFGRAWNVDQGMYARINGGIMIINSAKLCLPFWLCPKNLSLHLPPPDEKSPAKNRHIICSDPTSATHFTFASFLFFCSSFLCVSQSLSPLLAMPLLLLLLCGVSTVCHPLRPPHLRCAHIFHPKLFV